MDTGLDSLQPSHRHYSLSSVANILQVKRSVLLTIEQFIPELQTCLLRPSAEHYNADNFLLIQSIVRRMYIQKLSVEDAVNQFLREHHGYDLQSYHQSQLTQEQDNTATLHEEKNAHSVEEQNGSTLEELHKLVAERENNEKELTMSTMDNQQLPTDSTTEEIQPLPQTTEDVKLSNSDAASIVPAIDEQHSEEDQNRLSELSQKPEVPEKTVSKSRKKRKPSKKISEPESIEEATDWYYDKLYSETQGQKAFLFDDKKPDSTSSVSMASKEQKIDTTTVPTKSHATPLVAPDNSNTKEQSPQPSTYTSIGSTKKRAALQNALNLSENQLTSTEKKRKKTNEDSDAIDKTLMEKLNTLESLLGEEKIKSMPQSDQDLSAILNKNNKR